MCLVSLGQNEAVTVLPSGIVVDRHKLAQMSDEAVNTLMADVYAAGKPVVMVANANLFFTSNTIIGELENPTNPNYWRLIAEKFELSITEEDIRIISRAVEIRKEIKAKLKPLYPFASVPKDFNFDTAFQVVNGGASIKRRGGDYQIAIRQIRNLWGVASRYWAKQSTHSSVTVNTGGYHGSKTAAVYDTYIQLGCQRIERYELEQCATKQGWDFP